MGGPGGMMSQERKLVDEFDADKSGKLEATERTAAREKIKKDRESGGGRQGPGGRRRGPPMGEGGEGEAPKAGRKLSPTDIPHYPQAELYDPGILRTLFLEFENADWEAELADFYKSDVEVPAKLTVDGKVVGEIGVHFRGASSFFTVGPGQKRSLNLSVDAFDKKLRLHGYRTLNLLNGHSDPSFLHTVLYSQIARKYLPAPKANFVRVVINGECWGLYANAQQFNKDLVKEGFGSGEGARWKVRGSPGGRSGLEYTGDDLAEYKRRYQIKSADEDQSWQALVKLCKTLNETPVDELEAALKPMLDIEGVLRFLALDIALINGDGYWTRASDYSLILDAKGVFHVIPHDMNEALQGGGGPGMGRGGRGGQGGGAGGPPGGGAAPEGNPRPAGEGAPPAPPAPGGQGGAPGGPGGRPGGGPGGGGIELDPLSGLDDTSKPLRSRLLKVPALRKRYLELVREIARDHLDWKNLGPMVAAFRKVAEPELELDTRKLTPFETFQRVTAEELPKEEPAGQGRRPAMTLRSFAERRRAYLLAHPEIKKLD